MPMPSRSALGLTAFTAVVLALPSAARGDGGAAPAAKCEVSADFVRMEVRLRGEWPGGPAGPVPEVVRPDGRPDAGSLRVRRTAAGVEVAGPVSDLLRALVPGTRSLRLRAGDDGPGYRLDLPPLDIQRVGRSAPPDQEPAEIVSLTVQGMLPGGTLEAAEWAGGAARPGPARRLRADAADPVGLVAATPEGDPAVYRVRLPRPHDPGDEVSYVFQAVNPDGSRSSAMRVSFKDGAMDRTAKRLAAARPAPVDEWVEAPACELQTAEEAADAARAAGLVPVLVSLDGLKEVAPEDAKGEPVLRQGVAAGRQVRKGDVLLLLVRDHVAASAGPVRGPGGVDPGDDLGFVDPPRPSPLLGPGGPPAASDPEPPAAPARDDRGGSEDSRLRIPADPGISLEPGRPPEADYLAGVLRLVLDAIARKPRGETGSGLAGAIVEAVQKGEAALLASLARGDAVDKLPVEPILDVVAARLGIELSDADRQAALDAWRGEVRRRGPAALDRNRNRVVADDVAVWFIVWLWQRGAYDPATDMRVVPGPGSVAVAILPNKKISPDWIKEAAKRAIPQPLAPKPAGPGAQVEESEIVIRIPSGLPATAGSSTPDLVRIPPDLKGKSAGEAVRRLHGLGLKFRNTGTGRLYGLDEVMETKPNEKAWVKPGSVVELTVRRRVPPLKGKLIEEAEGELVNRDLRIAPWADRDRILPTDVVVRQSPVEGEFVDSGSRVKLGVARKVPDVKGLSPAAAVNRLKSAGFVGVHARGVARHDTVLDQDPLPSADPVEVGSEVKLTLRRPFPDVTKQSARDAFETAEEYGVNVGNRDDFDAARKAGVRALYVAAQEPPFGKIVRISPEYDTSRVRFKLTPGVKVPELLGRAKEGAEALLKAYRLEPDFENAVPADGPSKVDRQDTKADEVVALGSKVRLRLTAAEFGMPNLFRMQIQDAETLLKRMGLEARVELDGRKTDLVARQSPEKGKPVTAGQAVRITPGYEVPQVTRASQEDAERAIADAGGPKPVPQGPVTDERTTDARLSGSVRVLKQVPEANEVLARGEPVRLTLRRLIHRPAGVRVPDFRTDTLEMARDKVQRLALDLAIDGTSRIVGDNRRAGRVETTQDIPKDTEVEPGRTVILNVTQFVPERPRLVQVPNLVRPPRTVEAARRELAERGLSWGVPIRTDRQPDAFRDGTIVIGQSHEPGAEVPLGTPVAVSYIELVHAPPPPRMVPLPNLADGRTTREMAVQRLKAVGLVPGKVTARQEPVNPRDPNINKEFVTDQNPKWQPGRMVPAGSEVPFTVTKYVPKRV